ncbi:hypothetical protein BU23DRAFT_461241, partial [Bimuria novae-zelandiae CBS 107.79]
AKFKNYINNKAILQIAIKAFNNIASLNTFILTLLVFSAYLRINRDLPLSPDITV